jgi:YfiH family protein
MADWIVPEWPVHENIRAVITTRRDGFSKPPYDGFNLAEHVGDEKASVERNRDVLVRDLALPTPILWLNQVHGCGVAIAEQDSPGCEADAGFTATPGRVCAVLTADCLPLLLCNRAGTKVAAVHAGWRGLAAGVIEAALNRFEGRRDELLVWLGPAIGPDTFEVGDEVRECFVSTSRMDEAAFKAGDNGRWLADIYQLARHRLQKAGVGFVGGGDYCTVSDPERFYSYRRDGVTGRMASLIWIDEHTNGNVG